MKSGFSKLVLLIIGLSVFYTYIGLYFLPQSQSLPPKVIEIKEGIDQDELLKIGEDILFGKGQCMVCHPNKPEPGMRSPAIAGIGGVMLERVQTMDINEEEYIFQALVDTKAYVPEGFAPIMPPSQKLLTEGELIAVAAFLQSKGSDVTISYPESVPALRKYLGATQKKAVVASVDIKKDISQEELLKIGKEMFDDKGGCIECHPSEPDPDIEFPILTALMGGVEAHAKEKGRDLESFLFEALVNPGAYVAEGMDDIMPATQDELSNEEMIAVSAYIQSKGGKKVTVGLDSLSKLTKELEKAGGQ
jgi:mono/diheme cytochrome c family protein